VFSSVHRFIFKLIHSVDLLECTSAVSSDVEGRMYEALKALDITLITISLRFVSVFFISQLEPLG
jgi:ABC-type uncharacterized transport system fused permease/ATPase subunit